jgi:hypothetical protein
MFTKRVNEAQQEEPEERQKLCFRRSLLFNLHTNRYTDPCRGGPRWLNMSRGAERVFMQFIVLAQLELQGKVARPAAWC